MDSREITSSIPVPLVASNLLAGWLHGLGSGGKAGLRQCEDIRKAAPRLFPPVSSASTQRPGLPPPQFMSAIKKWNKGVQRRKKLEEEKKKTRNAQ